MIHSDAVPADNPELVRAGEMDLPVQSYFQTLGQMMLDRQGIAVAGTHGKSTTTAMLASLLIEAGHDPTVVFGAAPLGKQAAAGRAAGRCWWSKPANTGRISCTSRPGKR